MNEFGVGGGFHSSAHKPGFFKPSLEKGRGDSMLPISAPFLETAGALGTDI